MGTEGWSDALACQPRLNHDRLGCWHELQETLPGSPNSRGKIPPRDAIAQGTVDRRSTDCEGGVGRRCCWRRQHRDDRERQSRSHGLGQSLEQSSLKHAGLAFPAPCVAGEFGARSSPELTSLCVGIPCAQGRLQGFPAIFADGREGAVDTSQFSPHITKNFPGALARENLAWFRDPPSRTAGGL